MNFLTKVRALTLGAAHDLVDKAVDMNSPSILRQFTRDLEAAIAETKQNAAIQDGTLRSEIREKADLESSIALSKATITKLLASTDPSAPAIAKAKAQTVLQAQQHLADLESNITSQQSISDQMKLAVSNLEAKHEQIVARVRELERLDRDTKAKESAASAITSAGKIAGNIDNPSIDDLQDRMHRRNDVASSQFDAAMGDMQVDTPDSDDVNALLDSLKPQVAVPA